MVEGVGVASGVYKFLKGLEEKITLYWVLMVANRAKPGYNRISQFTI